MKSFRIFLVFLITILIFTGCGSKQIKPDFTTAEAESALNEGQDLDGKSVEITVDKLVPNSAFGYNIQTGDHLNFVSTENPKTNIGDVLIVKIKKVKSIAGSYIIEYEKISELKKETKSSSSENPKSESEESISSSKEKFDPSLYIDQTPFSDLMRTPETFKGVKQSFVAKVFQVSKNEEDSITQYLATVTPSENEKVTIMLLIKNDEINQKILDDDELRVWVRYIKPIEYDTVSGTTNEVPAFYLDHYNIIGS